MTEDAELARVERAYRERDAADDGRRLLEPASLLHRQELEWQLLMALRAAGIDIATARLLDIGSGDGSLLAGLARLGFRSVAGVELVQERRERAVELHPGLDIRLASATDLPFPDGHFDVVTQLTVLSSIHDLGTRRSIADEAMRVLRTRGVVLSYDITRAPRGLTLMRKALAGPPRDHATPTVPLDAAALQELWGRPERLRRVQLNLDLAEMLGGRRAATIVLRLLPPLRSHLLGTFRKT